MGSKGKKRVRSFLDGLNVNDGSASASGSGSGSGFNFISLRCFYPSSGPTGDPHESMTGILPFDRDLPLPLPVLVFIPGVNCPSNTYEWLMKEIVSQCSIVAVIFTWVAQNIPGRVSFTPGLNMAALKKDTFGKIPSSSSLPSILERVAEWNKSHSILKGTLDLTNVILAGHSAGGMAALHNANDVFWSHLGIKIKGVVNYCSNSLATTALGGFEKSAIPPIHCPHPVLMIAGTADGIGEHHCSSFGTQGDTAIGIIKRTLLESLAESRVEGQFVWVVNHANHFLVCDPLDETIGLTFLDQEIEPNLRRQICEVVGNGICSFINALKDNDFASFQQNLKSNEFTSELVTP